MPDKKAAVKKISPYPFEVSLQVAGRPMVIQILKVTHKGFLGELAKNVVRVGEEGNAQFCIPVFKDIVTSTVKVMRTYDQFRQIKEDGKDTRKHEVVRIAEFHFLTISETGKEAISRFIGAIGQAD